MSPVGDVRDLVADHRLDLLARHGLHQSGRDGNQRGVLECTGGEGIGRAFVDRDFRHRDAGTLGEARHAADQPLVGRVRRVVDDLRAGRPLGHRLADQQRNDRATETHHQREAQQRAQIEPAGAEVAVQAQQVHGDAQHHHHGDVGQQEQGDALHRILSKTELGLCGRSDRFQGLPRRPEHRFIVIEVGMPVGVPPAGYTEHRQRQPRPDNQRVRIQVPCQPGRRIAVPARAPPRHGR